MNLIIKENGVLHNFLKGVCDLEDDNRRKTLRIEELKRALYLTPQYTFFQGRDLFYTKYKREFINAIIHVGTRGFNPVFGVVEAVEQCTPEQIIDFYQPFQECKDSAKLQNFFQMIEELDLSENDVFFKALRADIVEFLKEEKI